MTPLQQSEIEQFWACDTKQLLDHMSYHAPVEYKREVHQQVLGYMALEGKTLNPDPLVANYYGGELAMRVREILTDWASATVAESRAKVHRAVCVQFRYCARRKAKEFEAEGLTLAIAIADALLLAAVPMVLPVTAVSVYLLKSGILDKWCDCDAAPVLAVETASKRKPSTRRRNVSRKRK
jgi:hypothetical protein